MRYFAALLAFVSTTAFAANAPKVPLPSMVVAKAQTPPVIDGKLSPGEWDYAPACTAFVRAFEGDLAHVQTVARMMYDDKYIYVAFTNFRGEKLALLQKRGRKNDDEGIVFDPSNEVWITPPGAPAATYQTLFNSYPAVLDVKMIPSVGYTAKAWRGEWEVAASESAESWTVEGRAPIAAFGAKIEDGATWRGLFTTDIFADGNAFRAWAAGGAFADIPRHGTIQFRENSAVFQLLNVESIFTGKAQFPMAVAAPAKGKAEVNVTLRFGAGPEPAADDVLLKRTISVADGKREEFTLSADLSSAKLPARKPSPKAENEIKYGVCEVLAKTSDGIVLYSQMFPFVIDGFVRHPPEKIIASPYETPFGLEAFYAPLSKKLLVKIDRFYMPQRAQAAAGQAKLVDPASGKVVAQRPVSTFRQDYSEFPIDLAELKVPIETEQDWLAAKPANDENQKIAAENKRRLAASQPALPLKDVPGPKPAEYRLDVTLADSAGKQIAAASIPVKLMDYEFEWLGNNIGISDKVIPPWTPMKWEAGSVSMWNKTYRLNGLGLADQITNAAAPQLSGAMKLIATVDGKQIPLQSPVPEAKKTAEAAIDLAGSGKAGDVQVSCETRVEFDGFVLNTMTVQPTKANVEKLSLVVTMPESEAPCFVTTAGGWAAYHGWTPEHWDSRETSIGSFLGNFVPYILLTDSDRGFTFFADNEKGWRLDPAQPTEEVVRKDGQVTLRVSFINKPGPIDKPLTMKWGWMVTPQKPQPKNWRAYFIGQERFFPQATCMFWSDADWAVLWPYYCSPFPWHYDKSKAALDGSSKRGVVGCVGQIAHAIARYCDYKGRWFQPVVADWGNTPGDGSNGNVARGRGPNDFQLWHFDKWVKESDLSGLYYDENYLAEDWNYLTGAAYLMPDERVQPGYSYIGLREYDKRLRYMFHDNGKPQPNLWLHTTSGQPVYAWMPDLAMEGENVEPIGGDNDYIEALPASRIRAIGMGRNLGAAPTVMCQVDNHWVEATSPFLVHQFVGWVLSHDVLPAQTAFWNVLAAELEIWPDDVKFLPYWKKGLGIDCATPDVNVSAHVAPGRAVLWIVNTARQDRKAAVKIDLAKIGFDPSKPVIAYDAETGERYAIADGAFSLDLPNRMWRAVRLMQPKALKGAETFVAHFDSEIAADEALGARWPRSKSFIEPLPDGKSGKCAPLDDGLSFFARHHISADRGKIAFQLRAIDPKTPGAFPLLTIGDLKLTIAKGKLNATMHHPAKPNEKSQPPTNLGTGALPESGWHEIAMEWKGKTLRITCDGAELIVGTLDEPMPIRPMARGPEIRDYHHRVEPTMIVFGPIKGGAIDDLVMSMPE